METQLFSNSLWNDIAATALKSPDKIVLKEINGMECSYATFVDDVNAYALSLKALGMTLGDRVLFLERPSIRAIKIFFAIYRTGAVAVVADPAMGRENFASRVEFARCTYVVLDPLLNVIRHIPGAVSFLRKIYAELPDVNIALPKVITLPGKAIQNTQSFSEGMRNNEDAALIIFTSGTTSSPKGVVHTFGSLRETLKLIQKEISTGDDDVFLSSQLQFSIVALISGTTAIIDTSTTFNPQRFLINTTVLRPTHTFLLPVEGQKLVECVMHARQTLPDSLRCIMFGSAPVFTGFIEKFTKIVSKNTRILCIYGSTEILPISIATAEEKLNYGNTGDFLGRLLPNVQVKLSGEELLISGPNLCHRYLHEDTPLSYFSSGDLGFVTKNGEIVMTGRKKDMIIKDHHNVYPAIFENTISKIPGVSACAMVGVYDTSKQDEVIFLFVENTSTVDDKKFIASVKKALVSGPLSIDTYALPDHIISMELPVSGRSRKINKKLLRELAASYL